MANVRSQLSLAALQLLRRSRTTNTANTYSRLFSTDTTARVSKQATIIKKLHKANKEIFGDLLESKTEKTKRAKELAKLKKAEAKKKKNTAVLSGNKNELHLDDNLDPTLIKTDTKPDGIHSIKANYVLDHDAANCSSSKDDFKAELNWAMKNFPQRARVISRFTPEVTLQSFESVVKADIQLVRKGDVTRMPEMSAKALNQAPTLKQLLASLELTDIQPRSEQEFISRDSPEVKTNGNTDTEIILDDSPVLIEEAQAREQAEEPPENVFRHDDEICETSFPDALPSISFDNPQRQASSAQLEIISYQYDYKNKLSTRLPSVSKILQATMSPEQVQILEKWQQKMIAQLGEDGFKIYKDALFYNGKELHKNLQLVLSGTPREYLTIDDAIFGHWNSLQTLLPEVKDVQVLESLVAHPQLGYCGIVDCVALYRDRLVLIDWKTSEKKKSFVSMTYDTPLQISAYIGALNHDPNYPFKVTNGLIVIAYQDGSPCQHFQLSPADLNRYWEEWLRRLNLYKKLSGDSTSILPTDSK